MIWWSLLFTTFVASYCREGLRRRRVLLQLHHLRLFVRHLNICNPLATCTESPHHIQAVPRLYKNHFSSQPAVHRSACVMPCPLSDSTNMAFP